ncbi:hypothetical protein NFI95_14385 [Acetobacteraceae bacterium KSS8]|uniref:Uncharacterized protein n=1 Tax=Endosaccharibacter trunci TaxID=2812733 RepID=A0ABT1W9R7_9PROT|nr:hypothetical protein [Acetobacteraceae bacterium KSS8]
MAAPEAAPAAHADPVGRDSATAMGRLFSETCFRHAGDAAGLRAELVPPRFTPMPDSVSRAVLPRPGQAFAVPGAPGHLMVLSFDDGWCGTGGTGIEPAALTNSLSERVRAAGGGEMKLMGADQAGREQRYLIDRPHGTPVALLVLLMPEPGGSPLMQASLFASDMKNGDAAP